MQNHSVLFPDICSSYLRTLHSCWHLSILNSMSTRSFCLTHLWSCLTIVCSLPTLWAIIVMVVLHDLCAGVCALLFSLLVVIDHLRMHVGTTLSCCLRRFLSWLGSCRLLLVEHSWHLATFFLYYPVVLVVTLQSLLCHETLEQLAKVVVIGFFLKLEVSAVL